MKRTKQSHWTHQQGLAYRQEQAVRDEVERIRKQARKTKPPRTRFTPEGVEKSPRQVARFYVVICGRMPGIYTKWIDCKRQVDGYTGAVFRKFVHETAAYRSLELGQFVEDEP